MFKQMLISSSARPIKQRKSFIYTNGSFKSTKNNRKLSSSLDRLNNLNHLNLAHHLTDPSRARCKSAKTYREINDDLELKETRDFLDYKNDLNKSSIIPELSIDNQYDQQINNQNDLQTDPEQANNQKSSDFIENPNVVRTLRVLSSKFRERAEQVKKKLEKQLSSENEILDGLSDENEIPNFSETWNLIDSDNKEKEKNLTNILDNLKSIHQFIYDFDLNLHTYELYSFSYISWLIILTIIYLYNCWFIVIRTFFPVQTSANVHKFVLFDLICDLFYLLDILWFKSRLRYYENGLYIKEAHLTRKKYFKKPDFVIDCLSLLPLDILYVFFGIKPLFRLPRLFKLSCFNQTFHCLDSIAQYPYIFRILKTLIYMMFLVHLNAAAYYYMSYLADFDPNNPWIYNNEGNAYLRCFYFAIRTATSISGRMPKPTNKKEIIFMTISWLVGVFVFAFLIGQIRDIVSNATQNETHYRLIMDQTINYMRNLNLPKTTQRRVKEWLNFTWKQQNTFDECAILNTLPNKSFTDISLNLHLEMLKQIELFQCVERPVICELATCLRPILFLPGDFIFQKDDLGTDMYIVNKGKVQVFADKEGTKLLATLGKGSVFGEISVLDLPGSSRKRTASIKSVGYSTLFRLQKTDLLEILSEYPEAHANLKRKANQLIKRKQTKSSNEMDESEFGSIRVESVIKNPKQNKLADTVIKLIEQKKRQSL